MSSAAPSRRELQRQLTVSVAQVHALLDQFADALQLDALTPGLQLTPIECGRLDEILGLGATRSVPDLLKAVDRLASLRFGDIRIPFTPGQLSELQHRAQKRGRTVEAEMKAVVDRIQDTLFYQGG